MLREIDHEEITSLDVSIAAGKGDKMALDIFAFTGDMLGAACADLQHLHHLRHLFSLED